MEISIALETVAGSDLPAYLDFLNVCWINDPEVVVMAGFIERRCWFWWMHLILLFS